MAYPEKKNPFYTEDDDDSGFGRYRSTGSSRGAYGTGGFDDISDEDFARPPMSRAEELQQLKQNSRNRQLESTHKALSSLYDSERMGVATAEELVHQGEQLDNVEKKLGQINADVKTSQKHLNSIKSIFGGIKNWWSGGKDEKKQEEDEKDPQNAHLRKTIEEHEDRSPHPAFRLRSEDGAGIYDHTDSQVGSSRGAYGGGRSVQRQTFGSSGVQEDVQLDKNLDMMSDGLTRLRGLALGLGGEIERQNDQIDRINIAADTTNLRIEDKNQQMRKILYNK